MYINYKTDLFNRINTLSISHLKLKVPFIKFILLQSSMTKSQTLIIEYANSVCSTDHLTSWNNQLSIREPINYFF